MKKINLAVLAIALSTASSFAVDSTGCGLGSTILKGKQGMMMQLFAVTTNGTSASQTFGITSGTLGCDSNGTISGGTGKIAFFLENNVDTFALDAASGQGETINVIAEIANTTPENAGALIKANYNNLFSNEEVKVEELAVKVAKLLNV
ncbi:MAG: DUF3015 domain-containing protein [Rickettsiales bacterium]|nr:MAG: DUF3015 domain-containing protein [Rickettsiales bacterium]